MKDFNRRDFLKTSTTSTLGMALGASALSAQDGNGRTPLVITNAKVLTVDAQDRTAEAFIVEGGKFTYVGTTEEALEKQPAGARVIDAQGATIIPGLNDSHTHVVRGGMMYAMELRWDGVSSVEEALELLRAQAARTPKGQWVRVVGGYSYEQFKEKRIPTLDEINEVVPDHPCLVKYLYAQSYLNEKAVEEIGYNGPDAPTYPGGYIARDRHGKATGLILADPSGLVLYKTLAKAPKLTHEEQLISSRHYHRELNSLGITSVADCGGGGMEFPTAYNVVQEMHDLGHQTVRIGYSTFPQVKGQEDDDYRRWTKEWKAGQGDHMLRFIGAGENICWAAYDYEIFAMPRPDIDADAEIRQEHILRTIHEAGWPSRQHMTYNETIDRLLPVYENVAHQLGGLSSHWCIDHAETITEHNMEKIAKLGGGIAIQNRIAYQAEDFLKHYGSEELAQTPPIRKMLEMGLPVGGGTDSTRVSSYNPWLSLEWLVTGKSVGGLQMYGDENLLNRTEALRAWTKGSAWFTSEEKDKGSIEVGQLGDFAVLDRDYLNVPDADIRKIRAEMTAVDGKIVHGSGRFAEYGPELPALKPEWSPVNEFGGYYPKA
ncbi:MAG: amidohydrolase family protein [Verrucomicrobiales bacterium]|nr:amidohydrolase family protein [Verrucomicrobiales bacterium]